LLNEVDHEYIFHLPRDEQGNAWAELIMTQDRSLLAEMNFIHAITLLKQQFQVDLETGEVPNPDYGFCEPTDGMKKLFTAAGVDLRGVVLQCHVDHGNGTLPFQNFVCTCSETRQVGPIVDGKVTLERRALVAYQKKCCEDAEKRERKTLDVAQAIKRHSEARPECKFDNPLVHCGLSYGGC